MYAWRVRPLGIFAATRNASLCVDLFIVQIHRFTCRAPLSPQSQTTLWYRPLVQLTNIVEPSAYHEVLIWPNVSISASASTNPLSHKPSISVTLQAQVRTPGGYSLRARRGELPFTKQTSQGEESKLDVSTVAVTMSQFLTSRQADELWANLQCLYRSYWSEPDINPL
jgi:hypothetical protein